MSPAPTISFLSDYGLVDEFVGVCHGVIAGICPEAKVIDLSHGVPRHAVLAGALTLRSALPFTPPGVCLAVVDPEVGARRRAVALRTADDDRLLVGPDNGLLLLAAERFGGVLEAVDVSASPWRLEPVSATFHGRDLFAPVAASLAAGQPLGEAGPFCDPAQLVALELPVARREDDGTVVAHVLRADGFGNLQLDVGHEQLGAWGLRLGHAIQVADGARGVALYARTFADVEPGSLLVYEDPGRALSIALNTGDAARSLGLSPGDEVRLRPLPDP